MKCQSTGNNSHVDFLGKCGNWVTMAPGLIGRGSSHASGRSPCGVIDLAGAINYHVQPGKKHSRMFNDINDGISLLLLCSDTSSVWYLEMWHTADEGWFIPNMSHFTPLSAFLSIPNFFYIYLEMALYQLSIILFRPRRWSRGQRVWLLNMRSRVRSPALPRILNVD